MTVVARPLRAPGRAPSARRMWLLAAAMLVTAGWLGWRLVDIQVRNPDRYLEHGRTQRVVHDELAAERGTIVDRNGVLLAGSVQRTTITANPRLVDDPMATATELAPLLGEPAADIADRLDRDGYFAFVARQVDDEVAAAVDALGLPGIALQPETARTNPGGDYTARALLGRADVDGVGVSGLEAQYDDVLTGVPGAFVQERATDGSRIPSSQQQFTPAVPGDSLVLTIDQTLQFQSEQVLAQHVDDTGSANGMAVMLDVDTGDVLAMATVSRQDDGTVVPSGNNMAVTWTYEPGSIAKPLTFAGVLEAGVADPDSYREVPDTYVVYDAELTDADEHETAWWSVRDILEKSSNVGTIMWAEQLGAPALHDTFAAFGLGRTTAVEFPHQASGTLHPVEAWSGTSLPTAAIGQGVAVTPLQMAQAYATIANGGEFVPPRLALGSIDGDGIYHALPEQPRRRVISEATATQITEMLTSVVAVGTGINAAIPGYETAGKTGTAWKPQPNGGYEDEDGERHFVASFAGYLPADDPAIALVVVLDEPNGTRESGGSAAAPVFAELSRYALRHLRIPPSNETSVSDQTDVRGMTLVERQQEIATRDETEMSDPPQGDPVADGHESAGAPGG